MLHEAIFLATCLATNVARQVARNISRATPPATATKFCVASCKKSRNILNFSQRCETSCCVWNVHRNLPRHFVKIGQSKPVFSSQEISNWRRKSCKQFSVGALQVAKKYCESVSPPPKGLWRTVSYTRTKGLLRTESYTRTKELLRTVSYTRTKGLWRTVSYTRTKGLWRTVSYTHTKGL